MELVRLGIDRAPSPAAFSSRYSVVTSELQMLRWVLSCYYYRPTREPFVRETVSPLKGKETLSPLYIIQSTYGRNEWWVTETCAPEYLEMFRNLQWSCWCGQRSRLPHFVVPDRCNHTSDTFILISIPGITAAVTQAAAFVETRCRLIYTRTGNSKTPRRLIN